MKTIHTFTMQNEHGEEVEYEVLFAFEDDQANKKYVVYTDHSVDEEGDKLILVAYYEEGELCPVESEEEWEMIEEILQGLLD